MDEVRPETPGLPPRDGGPARILAQKVSVVLDEDLTGGPAEQTVRLTFDGTDYAIDLNAKKYRSAGQATGAVY